MLVAIPLSQTALAQTPGAGSKELSLQAAESLFEEYNRELRAARRTTLGAEADILTASARPNPNLTISTSSLSNQLGNGSFASKRVDTVVGVSQVFERGNKAGLRTETAQAMFAAASNDEQDVYRTQRLYLQVAYYDLLQTQEKWRITKETATLFQRSVDALTIRLKAGDIAPVDVSRMNVDALRARNDARTAQADLEKAQSTLAYMIGGESSSPRLRATDSWPALVKPQRVEGEASIPARPDMQAAQSRVAAAEKNRESARALRIRDIIAGVQIERFPGNDPRNSAGFSVSIPLFTRYYYDGEIRRAESDFAAAQENLQRITALATAEIRKAASDLASTAERAHRLSELLLPAAEKAAQGAEFAYERGATGIMDLLDARRQLTAIRLEFISAQAEYAKALAAWRAAIHITQNHEGLL